MTNWFDKYLQNDEYGRYWVDEGRDDWWCDNQVIIDHFLSFSTQEEYDVHWQEQKEFWEKVRTVLAPIITEEIDKQIIEELLTLANKEGNNGLV